MLVLLPLWKFVRGRRRGLSGTFAPLVLVSSFVIWMSLLAVGFGLLTYASRAAFHPPLTNFGDAIFAAGSSLVTIGFSGTTVHGIARWVVLAAGFCGLAVMTMAVTYLLEVQSSISRRDTGIMKLSTSAGDPPSAVALLERFAAIRNQSELPEVLEDGRNWCATVRQSHSAHPSLIYFQTEGTGAGWPAALGALLDLALIAELCLDDEALFGPAVLLHDDGVRLANELAALLRLTPKSVKTNRAELNEVTKRLAQSGYGIRAELDMAALARQRAQSQSAVCAIADHLGKPAAVLLREPPAAPARRPLI